MNTENINIMNSMLKIQYYDFIRYALGMKYFLKNNGYVIQAKTDDEDGRADKKEKKPNKNRNLATLYKDNKRIKTYYVTPEDFEKKTFHDDINEIHYTNSYFDEIDDGLLWAIMIGVVGAENHLSNKMHIDIDFGKQIFEKTKQKSYRFILGAGVNSGYGLGGWNDLLTSIRTEIQRIKNISIGANSIFSDFEESMSNTSYISPQILKDLDQKKYYDVIYDNLYSVFKPQDTDILKKPSIEDTTLYQVARIISKQIDKSMVLTFNYDNVLEQVLHNCFNKSYKSVYYNYRNGKLATDIDIIHSHGFYPYGKKGKKYAHEIVLSCFEYMNSYATARTYARNKLITQIARPNIIIGNSMSDYEEQKVFFTNHKQKTSDFSYLFITKINPDKNWMDEYKTIYFLKMGVIPVFFDSFDQMVVTLKKM